MYHKKTNNLFKKISAFALISAVLCGFIIVRDYNKPTITKAESCSAINYYNDFDIFLSNLVSYDDFSEYFKDIFSRNSCQRDDIFMLETLIQKQTKLIRQAYENCNNGILDKLTTKAYLLQVELMYLRKFALNNPDKAAGQPEMVANDLVYTNLWTEFVKNKKIFKDSQFIDVYKQIAAKYETKLDAYNNCVDVSWKDLTEKWDEFVAMRAGMTPAVDRMKQSIQNKEKKINEAPPKSRANLMESLFALGINGVDAPQGLNEIVQEYQKNKPGFMPDISEVNDPNNPAEDKPKTESGSNTTGVGFDNLINKYASEAARYEKEKDSTDVLTKYRFLYRDDADESIKALIEKIDDLNKTIEGTFPVEQNLFKCTKEIKAKQCKNKS
ncbi:MAG: hypothetical protein UT33_C0009G0099 [Candidatus Peregrinibacteria bacterium GW2011_GWC2_39_14]|nr:MAG: hypothetical protein US92_C0005G0099 [Candidatus Peregrinibacteria bacterium GW2011_GWA2_38_36]KKR06648.1 MAG: hypothetical protein UT33_C0009G0099 [Candidatus Peregrinibacteria bacterium GW2011_GWC2_39_14]